MRILYEKIEDRETGGTVSGAEASAGADGTAVRVCRCFGWDGEVEIPEEIEGLPVREIGAYAFAPVLRRETPGEKFTAWIGELPERNRKGMPRKRVLPEGNFPPSAVMN